MIRETSRYKLNKFISETPIAKISYQPDVTKADLQHIQTELEKRTSHTSLTIIVVVILQQDQSYKDKSHMIITFQQYLKNLAKQEREQQQQNDPLPDQRGYVRK